MAITYYMLQIPPALLFVLLFVVGAFLGGFSTYLFRKYVRLKIARSHNQVIGFHFLTSSGFYSLLLSFIVLVVWDQLNETRGNASREGSSAIGLYREIKYYPDTAASQKLMASYLDFVFSVIDDEYPKMAEMKTSRETEEALDRVYLEMEHMQPRNDYERQLIAEMFNHLNELARYRGLRISTMDTEISAPLWLPIMIGAVLSLCCALLLDLENGAIHIGLVSILGAFVGIFIFTIVLLDHPYTGELGIQPDAYLQIFEMEEWSEEETPDLSGTPATDSATINNRD